MKEEAKRVTAAAADECNASLTVTLSAKCGGVTYWGLALTSGL